MRCPTCSSARGPTARTCPRRMPSSRNCAPPSTRSIADGCCLPRQTRGPWDVRFYLGEGDSFRLGFHSPGIPRLFMAIRREERTPIEEILQQTPQVPFNCQWALFLRNHDELTLEMVTDEDRDYMYREYAKDARMRLNLGIRRRLAPLMENGRPR